MSTQVTPLSPWPGLDGKHFQLLLKGLEAREPTVVNACLAALEKTGIDAQDSVPRILKLLEEQRGNWYAASALISIAADDPRILAAFAIL
jgi:hypothetical protein